MELIDKQSIIDVIQINRDAEWKKSISGEINHKSVVRSKHDAHVAFCDYLIKAIQELPTVAKKETVQWIPAERLPEEAGSYICSCKDGDRDMISMIKWQPRQKAWNLTGQRAYWRVIAWQYLPEPYKGEEE